MKIVEMRESVTALCRTAAVYGVLDQCFSICQWIHSQLVGIDHSKNHWFSVFQACGVDSSRVVRSGGPLSPTLTREVSASTCTYPLIPPLTRAVQR